MVAEKEKTEKAPKPVKKIEKFIWFLVSAVLAAAGALCHINSVKFNIWVSVIYSALLFFAIIMAAQRTSSERFGYAYSNEDSQPNKIKYVLTSVLYYIFIIVAVAYAFLALWVSGVFSV